MLNISIGELIWVSVLAGIVGTGGMTLFLMIVTKSGIAHADMVRAVGSFVTKSMHSAFRVGILIHIGWGIFFAFLYTLVIALYEIHNPLSTIGMGMLLGFIHGFSVGMMLVVAVGEHHPVKEFHNPSFAVAVAHMAAHIVYGFLVGMVVGLMGY